MGIRANKYKEAPLENEKIVGISDDMAKQALRVLAVAYKDVSGSKKSLANEDMKGLVFLGLQGPLSG